MPVPSFRFIGTQMLLVSGNATTGNCCCGTGPTLGYDCVNCAANSTPATIRLSFSGIGVCTACQNVGNGTSFRVIDNAGLVSGGSLDISGDAAQVGPDPDSCLWYVDHLLAIQLEVYSDATCTTLASTETTLRLGINRLGTNFYRVSLETMPSRYSLFTADLTIDCDASATSQANGHTACDGPNGVAGHGGTVDFTPL